MMTEPTAEQWERLEEQPSADLKAVLDYVDELQAALAGLDALAGLTPAQIAAIPRVRAWLSRSPVTADELRAWIGEYEELKATYTGD